MIMKSESHINIIPPIEFFNEELLKKIAYLVICVAFAEDVLKFIYCRSYNFPEKFNKLTLGHLGCIKSIRKDPNASVLNNHPNMLIDIKKLNDDRNDIVHSTYTSNHGKFIRFRKGASDQDIEAFAEKTIDKAKTLHQQLINIRNEL